MKEIRIFGPPGTGKTTKLINDIIPKAVAKYGYEKVILCSFTKAAAKELASRLDVFAIPFNQDLPEDDMEGLKATTLHALCFAALGKPKLATAAINRWNEENPQYLITSEGGGSTDEAIVAGSGQMDILSECNILRNQLKNPLDFPSYRAFYQKWTSWKQINRILDFTDLIEVALQTIQIPPGNASCIICDECQDLTPLQFKLIRSWGLMCDVIYLAGDDDQCIYQWTGVDPQAFITKNVQGEIEKIVLNKSYRLPKEIYDYSSQFIKQVKIREDKEFTHNDTSGEVVRLGYNYTHGSNIVDVIKDEISHGSVMLLASCSYMLKSACDIMKEEGIKFCNPYRLSDKAWNPCSTKGFEILESVKSGCQFYIWGEFINKKLFKKGMTKKALSEDIETLNQRYQVEDDIDLVLEGLNLMEKYLDPEVFDSLDDFWGDIGKRTEWLYENMIDSEKKRLDYAMRCEKSCYKFEHDIIVGSIHSVKGGEANTVIVIPDVSYAAYQQFLKDTDPMIRLMYVAVTRARKKLILLSPATRMHVKM